METVEQLVSRLQDLTHDERMKILACYSSSSGLSPDSLSSFISDLLSKGVFEILMGIRVCHGARLFDPLLPLVRHESSTVRHLSASALFDCLPESPSASTTDQMVQLLLDDSLSRDSRVILLRKLGKCRKAKVSPIADRVVSQIHSSSVQWCKKSPDSYFPKEEWI